MEILFGVLIGLFVLVLLVVVHELGHAIAAKRSGVVVEEFGVGFPPRAWGKKLKNGVLLSLNWLPLGGFVKLQGEHDSAKGKGDYGAATYWQKTKILFAGVLVNWVVAVLLLTGLALAGLPKIIPDQFSVPGDTQIISSPVTLATVESDFPAAEAGFAVGDEITAINSQPIDTVSQFIDATQALRGETVTVEYVRDGQPAETQVALRDAEGTVFGAALGQQEKLQATWSAPIVGLVTTLQFTGVTLQGLGQLFVDFFGGLFAQLSLNESTREQGSESLDRAANSVAGPVGILGVIFPQAGQAGLAEVIFLAAIISLTLAVMNTLPIPALDGGRWFVTTIFKVFRKPLGKDREEKIHGTGFLILMGLIILVTIADVTKLIS